MKQRATYVILDLEIRSGPYVGSTTDFERRRKEHLYKGSLKKDGEVDFEPFDGDDLRGKEQDKIESLGGGVKTSQTE
ncbi:MAG: hypothetical protein SFX74_05335 [Fimbriimonadaceae bacterium]|nr:hypothetical protein [Fimbriimonadaceae bacterium]